MFDFIDHLNVSSLIALIIRFAGFVVVGFYLFPKQLREVLRPVDWLTRLRWQILALLSVSVISGIPSIWYQIIRLTGGEAEILRNISTVTSNISQLLIIILLVLIFNYKRKS